MRTLLFLAFLLPCGIAVAQQPVPDRTPEDLIRFVYSHYVGKTPTDDPSFAWSSKPLVDRLFEPALAKAVVNAGKASEPLIGSDPFVDGQDFEIASYDLKTDRKTKDSARIVASFINLSEPRTVTYTMRRLNAGWRIADISWGRTGDSFRKMMRVR